MSRKLIGTLTAIAAFGGLIAGSTLVWPNTSWSPTISWSLNTPWSTGGQTLTARADFEHAFTNTDSGLPREYVPAFLPMIDFERHFTGENALPPREYVPVRMTVIEFDRAFRSAQAASRDNTPINREKLRNAGWKRVLGSS